MIETIIVMVIIFIAYCIGYLIGEWRMRVKMNKVIEATNCLFFFANKELPDILDEIVLLLRKTDCNGLNDIIKILEKNAQDLREIDNK